MHNIYLLQYVVTFIFPGIGVICLPFIILPRDTAGAGAAGGTGTCWGCSCLTGSRCSCILELACCIWKLALSTFFFVLSLAYKETTLYTVSLIHLCRNIRKWHVLQMRTMKSCADKSDQGNQKPAHKNTWILREVRTGNLLPTHRINRYCWVQSDLNALRKHAHSI